MTKFHGVIPAVITPFSQDYEVDIEGLRENIRFLIEKKVHGIMVNGCTGEAASLNREERIKVMRARNLFQSASYTIGRFSSTKNIYIAQF